MSQLPQCYGIIPARYASKRFPGKPLALILGRPMFWHVIARARECPELVRVVLATDDRRILAAAHSLDVPAVMTGNHHPSGTDRVLEAAQLLQIPRDAIVVNIQGDEPALQPAMLSELVAPFRKPEVQVTTLAHKLNPAEAQNPDRVKVVFASNGQALYFSRSPIPFQQAHQPCNFYGHIGLYAFRMATLERFAALKQGCLEAAERLEQLRLLEHSIPIHVVTTRHESLSVDRPADIQILSALMQKQEMQCKANPRPPAKGGDHSLWLRA
ncbi:MAG: 3-deoxy-manno-octulosonate cytidylyltransferase [Desulfobacterales bacterium]|nr:MAG: 3-deoxy-manno-octulosonate cytidylyltransferase [Desulfobacterales bacterium]